MRLRCGLELFVDAEMHVDLAAPQPKAAALLELGRFRHFFESDDVDVKRTRATFTARWHRELQVIESYKWCGHYLCPSTTRLRRYARDDSSRIAMCVSLLKPKLS